MLECAHEQENIAILFSPYLPNPPNSEFNTTQGDPLPPLCLEIYAEVASLQTHDMPNEASCTSVEESCVERCEELPPWLTDLDTYLNSYDQMRNLPWIAPHTVFSDRQDKPTWATPSVPSPAQDPQQLNPDLHSADPLPNRELSYSPGGSPLYLMGGMTSNRLCRFSIGILRQGVIVTHLTTRKSMRICNRRIIQLKRKTNVASKPFLIAVIIRSDYENHAILPCACQLRYLSLCLNLQDILFASYTLVQTKPWKSYT